MMMNDNERIQAIKKIYGTCTCRDCLESNELFLLQQLEKLDKQVRGLFQLNIKFHDALQYVLKQIEDDYTDDEIKAKPLLDVICNTIREALTVSKQEGSTVSEVACEQTNKDSLNVARQNNPTHPTQQINRLAQEVAVDMQWREGEKP